MGGVRGRIGIEDDDVVHAGADRRDVEKTKVEWHRVTGGKRRERAQKERMLEDCMLARSLLLELSLLNIH